MNDDIKAYKIAESLPKVCHCQESVLAETYKKRFPPAKSKEFIESFIGEMLILFNNQNAYSYKKNPKECIDSLVTELLNFKNQIIVSD